MREGHITVLRRAQKYSSAWRLGGRCAGSRVGSARMIIPVVAEGGTPEWCMIELQVRLERRIQRNYLHRGIF